MPFFAQLVVGPPGAGKTTYCDGMQQMCNALGREHAVVNLDPANDALPYEASIDICHQLSCESVMEEHGLGPNGALLFCMESLLTNVGWLIAEIRKLKGRYLVFDLPGQVELYVHHEALPNIIAKLQKELDVRFCAVHLVDSTLCTDAHKYISSLLVSLCGQIFLELPHVNVLTKSDLLLNMSDQLEMPIDFYTEVQDLDHLLTLTDHSPFPRTEKFRAMNGAICELIEEFNLISFHLLNVQEKESVVRLLNVIDTANGFSIGGLSHDDVDIFSAYQGPLLETRDARYEQFYERMGEREEDDGTGEGEAEGVKRRGEV